MEEGRFAANRSNGRRRPLDRPQRIAVVDDDDIQRAGLVVVLGHDHDVGAVEEDTVASALDRSGWAGVDVVVVHLRSSASGPDHLRGVEVIARIRLHQAVVAPRLVALCSLPEDHSAMVAARLEALELGSVDFVSRGDHPTGTDLCDALLRPSLATSRGA